MIKNRIKVFSVFLFSFLVLLATKISAGSLPVGTVLLDKNFEDGVLGFTQAVEVAGDITIVADPLNPTNKCVKMVDSAPGGWQPAFYGGVDGAGDVALQFDLDWYLTALDPGGKQGLYILLREHPVADTIQIYIGGMGGIRAAGQTLNVPITLNQWNHLTVIADPVSCGANGTYDLVITQGTETWRFENLPFQSRGGVYGTQLKNAPFISFANGVGTSMVAYLDNIKLKVISR